MEIRLLLIFLLFCISCRNHNTEHHFFELLTTDLTGVDFENTITETDTFNILEFDYIYNGGGVAIGDFNNDALPDIFFTGNSVSNRLYLNQGEMRFKDVTPEAGLSSDTWSEGVTLIYNIDDGFLDIYVSVSDLRPDSFSRNLLYVNQGLIDVGIRYFIEMAADFVIDDMGYN